MNKSIIINNPSEEVTKLFQMMKEHKHRQLEKMKDMKKGIFSIEV